MAEPNSRQLYIYLRIMDTSQAAILLLGTVQHCMVIDCSAQHTILKFTTYTMVERL